MEITPEIQALLDAQKTELTAAHDEDVKGIKQNRDDLLEEKRIIGAEKQAALDLAEEQRLAKAKAEGDTDTLSKSYEEKNLSLQAQIDSMNAEKVSNKLGKLADAFVNEYALDNQFIKQSMAAEYKKRIDYREGKVVVLDPNGSLTANTIEDLNKEFVNASLYQDHLKGTGATGGGATGNKGGGAAVSLKNMTATEEAIFANHNPELYKQLLK